MGQCTKIPDKVFKNIARKEISKIGSALSDPNRVEILDILSQGEQNVEQITFSMKSHKGLVSHHLQILKNVHLVESRKEGRYVYYSMPEASKQIWYTLNLNSQALSSELVCAINSFFDKKLDYTNSDYKDLIKKINSGDVVLIDVRPESEYTLGHFPGALSVPLEKLQDKMRNLPRNTQIIAYCRGPLCILAENAVNILRLEKYDAYRWKESIVDWTNRGIRIKTS